MPLLDAADVRALVPQEDFSDEQLAVAMLLVTGWLREDSGRTALPTAADGPLDATDPLFSAALELVALIAENPTSLASRTSGPTSRSWPQAVRRDAIRASVKSQARRASNVPSGDFPDALPWPDRQVFPAGGWTT